MRLDGLTGLEENFESGTGGQRILFANWLSLSRAAFSFASPFHKVLRAANFFTCLSLEGGTSLTLHYQFRLRLDGSKDIFAGQIGAAWLQVFGRIWPGVTIRRCLRS
jgi:hypothetical protein